MTTDDKETFLRRWSRVKHEAEKAPVPAETAPTPKPELPPLDKLTPDSDFTGFMHPKVEDALRRAALKKLFKDPHFNIPDPYEPYSRDFNIADPIPPELLATLKQAEQLVFGEKKKESADEQQTSAQPEPQPATKTDEPGKQDA